MLVSLSHNFIRNVSFPWEVSNIPLDAVVLEGSVLVHLPKLTVIQTVHLCNLSWIYLESNLSSHAHLRASVKDRTTKAKDVFHDC